VRREVRVDRFREWVRAAWIERRVRWHDLRHMCASSLVAGWWGRRWSLEEVREMLGHSSVLVTERYAHFAESAIDSAARQTRCSEGTTKVPRTDFGGASPSSVAAIRSDIADLVSVGRAGLEPRPTD
jgi:hypothetical protein